MKRILAIVVSAIALPGVALAASRTYDTAAFDAISVASGMKVDITVGPATSVVAENKSGDFEDLRILVEGKTLRIGRPSSNWLSNMFSGTRPEYKVHVVAPVLRSLVVSSGAEVTAGGSLEGDFSVNASSGSEVEVSQIKGGNVKASASSGSEMEISGSCISLTADASSGSDVDADDLKCENVTVHTSSGSDISVYASKRVSGEASSGSDVLVRGRPPQVQVETSSGADVTLRD